MHKNLRLLSFLAVALIGVSVSEAKTCVWTGKGTPSSQASGNLIWPDAGNWEGGNVPANGDTVVIEPTSATTIRPFMTVTLENFYFTNRLGTTLNGDSNIITLTGSNSVIYTEGDQMAWYQCFNVTNSNSKLTINVAKSGSLTLKLRTFLGLGEVEKVGEGDINFFVSNQGFAGKLTVLEGTAKMLSDDKNTGTLIDPFGGENSEAHFYTSIDNRRNTTCNGKVFLHSGSSSTSVTTYRTMTFNNDLTFSAEAKAVSPYLQGIYHNSYYSSESVPGYVINGRFICDNSKFIVSPQFYSSYECSEFFVELNCEFVGWMSNLTLSRRTGTGDTGKSATTVYLNTPFVTGLSSPNITLLANMKLICGAKNVLNGSSVTMGSKSSDNAAGALLDLNGCDQECNWLRAMPPNSGNSQAVVKSDKTAIVYAKTPIDSYRTLPILNGHVSVRVSDDPQSGNSTAVKFHGGDTDGWLSFNWGRADFRNAGFTALSGIELTGTADMILGADSFTHTGVMLDLHDRNSSKCTIIVPTDQMVTVASVIVDNGIIEPDTYCCSYSSVGTKASWMSGSKDNSYNGGLVVAGELSAALWTGSVGDGNLNNGKNWASGKVPDFSNSSVKIDLRRASADNLVVLSDNFTPNCQIVSYGFPSSHPTFGGDGALVLSWSGINKEINYDFLENASLIWNGTGGLYYSGCSSTAGDLVLNSGSCTMWLNRACWQGVVAVMSGVTLTIPSACSDSVLSNNTKLELYGVIDLGDGIDLSVRSMTINDQLAIRNQTYGSTSSAAKNQDDAHFAGTGVISSLAQSGSKVIFK